MSSTTIICIQLIILITNVIFIRLTIAISQCDLSSAINLQWATYSHSLILRVQPIRSSEQGYAKNMTIIRKVLVREVIKMSRINRHQDQLVKMNDIVIIKINDNDNEYLDDSCWHLLRISTVDIILFLNDTNTNEFDLHYPPVESTFRTRQHIDVVLNHETYPPKVLIKTRLDKAILSKDYFLQCNSRGNPLPRLLWSKKNDKNDILEYYPLSKQCKTSCRIYSVQHKYQSILYFRPLIFDDIGIYICHAENPMNHTTTSVYLNIDNHHHHHQSNINVTCSSLKNCHDHGQCIIINNQMKCVCDNRYFGEQCETNYDDIIKKQDSAILLFQSRFLAGCILFSVAFLLLLLAAVSWFLARNNRKQQKKLKKKLLIKKSTEKPLVIPAKETNPSTKINGTIPSSTPIEQINKPRTPPPPPATVHISHLPGVEKNPLIHPIIRQTNMPAVLTRESSIATDDDDDDGDGIYSYLRHCQTLPPVPTKIDEEYEERFSLKMNKSEEHGLGYLTNGINNNELSLSHSYVDFYQPDHQTGLIKPLNIRKDPPERYTKYVSSYSKFVLPRPVKSSSLEYQQ
ncbi:unnamed protein product [Rotaria sp. Silwood2]|nr:unnamed protein product [Rotaria sp. Silwood2]CAF2928763.1 unnamed protein product [Rotaria sp. Silwood2]CAF4094847.1 unnamed protein product [Rotaria sp. Silwood2]